MRLTSACTHTKQLSKFKEDDFLSKKELEAINQGLKDIQDGRTFRMLPDESLEEFLSRTEEKHHV